MWSLPEQWDAELQKLRAKLIGDVKPSAEALQTMRARGGDWFVYQDHCFESASLGDLQFLQCGVGRTFVSPPARMPDTQHSIGWRYIFVGKVNLETGSIEVQQL